MYPSIQPIILSIYRSIYLSIYLNYTPMYFILTKKSPPPMCPGLLPQENGSDSSLMSLRTALQKVERGGAVDYTLGGHRCERPPQVQQGHADDQFTISPDPDSPLLWRPSAIAMRNLKANNVASHFSYTQLAGSALKLVPGLRFHSALELISV